MIEVCTKSLEKCKELATFGEWEDADGLKETEAWQSTELNEDYRQEGNGKHAERNALISLRTTVYRESG